MLKVIFILTGLRGVSGLAYPKLNLRTTSATPSRVLPVLSKLRLTTEKRLRFFLSSTLFVSTETHALIAL
ncbi:MAG: hypothetical protein QW075_03955 [Thermofilaceae archaeon]